MDGPQAAIPWRRIVRQLSLAYHWTPRQIAELTLRQVALYLTDTPDSGSTASLSPTAGLSLSRQRRAEKAAWIEACLTSR